MNPIVETLLIFGSALFFIAVGMIIVPLAERRGWIKPKNVKMTEQMLALLKAIINKNLNNKIVKDKANLIYDCIIAAFKFAQRSSEVLNIEDKKQLIYDQTLFQLSKFEIELDDDDKLIIEIIIDNAVDLLEK